MASFLWNGQDSRLKVFGSDWNVCISSGMWNCNWIFMKGVWVMVCTGCWISRHSNCWVIWILNLWMFWWWSNDLVATSLFDVVEGIIGNDIIITQIKLYEF